MKYNDPNKPGYTDLSPKQREQQWMKFFSCDDGGVFVQKVLYERDKSIIKKVIKRCGFVEDHYGGYVHFKNVND